MIIKTAQRSILIPYLVVFFACFSSSKAYSFTVGEEREVGEKLLYAIRANFPVIDDPDIHQYLSALGREVLDVAGFQYFDYRFFVVKNKDFNAFAAPSGLIFFYTGLIETMESEEELVSVLAHEIGHVAKRHISSRIDKNKKISIATIGLALASLALGGGAATQALLAGSIAAGESMSLHFSRQDEEEADLLAFEWMKAMKRNPKGQEKMLQTMRQIARYRSAMVPQYLLTHPNPEARLDYVQSLIASQKEEIKDIEDAERFSFLRFKSRIMSLSKENTYLRSYYSSILASSRASQENVAMAKYGIALLERSENNYSRSLELLDEVIDFYPQENLLKVDKGIIEYESGRVDRASQTLSAAYNRDRNNMYAAFYLAKALFKLGRIEQAETLFKSVMYSMPEYPGVYFELGRLSSETGKTSDSNYYLGKYYLFQGKLQLARKNLNAAREGSGDEEVKLDIQRALELIDRLEKKE